MFSWFYSSYLDSLAIDYRSEEFSILNSILPCSIYVVVRALPIGLSHLNWEHETLFKCLHKFFLMFLLDDVLDLDGSVAACLECDSDCLAVLVEVDARDGVAHVAVHAVHPVQTEEKGAVAVETAAREEQVVYNHHPYHSQEVLHCCLFDLPRDIAWSLGSSDLMEDSGDSVLEVHGPHRCVKDVVVEGLVGCLRR